MSREEIVAETKRIFMKYFMFFLGFAVATLLNKYSFWLYIQWIQWRYGVCK